MPVGAAIGGAAVIGAGASVASSKAAGSAAKSASNTSAKAAASDRALQWQMYQQQRGDTSKYYDKARADVFGGTNAAISTLSPYDDNGAAATNRLAALAGVGGVGAQTEALASDPGYQFRLSQGTAALDRSAASRGLLLSGAQAKGLAGYGQGLASDELNNAYNRTAGVADAARGVSTNIAGIQQGRGTTLANLATGQSSANQALTTGTTNALTNISQTNAANQSQAAQALGAARGSAYTGVANAATGAAQNGLFYYGMQNGWFKNGATGVKP